MTDPSGAVIPGALVRLRNSVTGYEQTAVTGAGGAFKLTHIPQNNYQLTAGAAGFTPSSEIVDIRSSVPLALRIKLQIAAETTSVTVESGGSGVEESPSAHQDVDRSTFSRLPSSDPAGALNQAITLSSGAVAADANGFYHPLGDHAQTTMVIDGQPVSDQQSKVYSTQIPANAIQALEVISGTPDAQYGDKTSLVVSALTRSGMGAGKTFGDVDSRWGSFGAWGGSAALGFGGARYGNFVALNGVRSGRFLDTPEYTPLHGRGNNVSIFDHFDWQPAPVHSFHLNLFTARNWFQVPNSYDQLGQDQRQRVLTWSVAPGYQYTLNAHTLLTVRPYVRRDQLDYYPSRDPFADTPATAAQQRFLTNHGVKADLSRAQGRHNIKIGTQLQQTRLAENFRFGITDPAYNPVCLDPDGEAVLSPGLTNPAQCGSLGPGFVENPDLLPGIVPFDLTRGGGMFAFRGRQDINQAAFYATDAFKFGNLTVNAGLRAEHYGGLASANSVQPRVGLAFMVPYTSTVLRAAYARTFETPFNENLILSSGTGGGGLARNVFGSQSTPIEPGRRNQFNLGLQQGLGRWLIFDADYFWKITRNAYDFSVLFNTPITFPIAWRESRLDGVAARLNTVSLRGFQAYLTLGHTRARYFPPETGGLVPLGGFADTVFRIDHDQAYQQTVSLRYQRPRNAEWFNFIWRYDSGLVVGGVADVADALSLTAAQQVAMGFSCDGTAAAYGRPITECEGTGRSTLLTLPQTGTGDPDHNPNRVKPRHLLGVALGTDNLFHKEKGPRVTLRFEAENLTNRVALYNFLSTFSGTHFVAPRTVQVSLGLAF